MSRPMDINARLDVFEHCGTWYADLNGEPGDPLINPDPKPGEPGHVIATGCGETLEIAVMRCIFAAEQTE